MISLSPGTTRRGFDAEDSKWFSEKALEQMRIAQQEVQWLLDRGYKVGPVINFVGGHYQLSSRQRIALQRATSSNFQYDKRNAAQLPMEAAKDGRLNIDGLNLIITLEVALSGSILILGRDGVLRDLAGLRGSYRIIKHTEKAIELIGKSLKQFSVPAVKFFLDAPVSNSGKLRNMIFEHSNNWNLPVEVELAPNVDSVLSKIERIVTGDSVILDHCQSWFNLARVIVDNYIKDAWIICFN
ncbi:MAG TPA: DUF434 domain-containing protein [Desulfitobacteriaceae bacterium]|nr:DUF434 domain-containing protein [Desulfitobacteriaceae bacterium]